MAIGMDAYNPEYSGIYMPSGSAREVFNDPSVQSWASSLYDPAYSGITPPETATAVINSFSNGNLLKDAASGFQNATDAVSSVLSGSLGSVGSVLDPNAPSSGASVYRKASGRSKAQPINYVDAPIAERYGLNAETAYNESLANTAHQREVQDLLKAGLNPVLSARYGGSSAPSTIYVPTSGRGSFGSGGGSYNSARRSGDFFTRLLKGVAPDLVGLVVGAKTSRSTANSARSITRGLLDALL